MRVCVVEYSVVCKLYVASVVWVYDSFRCPNGVCGACLFMFTIGNYRICVHTVIICSLRLNESGLIFG